MANESNEELIEFSSNLSLCDDDDKNRFQFLYGTHLYGTLFGVFINFGWHEQSNASTRTLDKITFVGVNYKGPVNLELVPDPHKPNEIFIESGNEPAWKDGEVSGFQMNLWVRASQNQTNPKLTRLDLDVAKIRNLQPLQHGNYIRVDRKLQRMNPAITTIPEEPNARKDALRKGAFVNGQFDSEFYERDGAYVRPARGASTTIASGPMLVRDSDPFGPRDFYLDEKVKANVWDPVAADSTGGGSDITLGCTPAVHKLLIGS